MQPPTTGIVNHLTVLEKSQEFSPQELQEMVTGAVNTNIKTLARETGQTEQQVRNFLARLVPQIRTSHMVRAGSQPIRIVPNEHHASLVSQIAKANAGQGLTLPDEFAALRPKDDTTQIFAGPFRVLVDVQPGDIIEASAFDEEILGISQNGAHTVSFREASALFGQTPDIFAGEGEDEDDAVMTIAESSRLGHQSRFPALQNGKPTSVWGDSLAGKIRVPNCTARYGVTIGTSPRR